MPNSRLIARTPQTVGLEVQDCLAALVLAPGASQSHATLPVAALSPARPGLGTIRAHRDRCAALLPKVGRFGVRTGQRPQARGR